MESWSKLTAFANDTRLSIVDAAKQAAAIRFRPIIMTSLAFMLGILPLAFATGVGSASRNSMGTAVFGGMLVSTVLNLLLVPVLYISIITIQERTKSIRNRLRGHKTEAPQNVDSTTLQ